MKITKDQLKQIIKEEIEDSLMDEGVLDIAKNIGAAAIGKIGYGGKASSQGQAEVNGFFDKQFLDLVNNTPKPASDSRFDFSDSYAGLPKELSDEQKNTIIAANRLAAYVIHNEPGDRKLLSKMRTGVGAYIYEMGLARKKKIAPNFKKGGIPKNITINNAEDMRLAITILEYGYSAFNKTKAKFAANTTQMFNRVLAPDNLFKKMTVDIQKELEDFYQTRVSGRTIGQARHDTVLGIGAYLVELREEVGNNSALFDRVMKPFTPKRQLNKALEESKTKITKTQLKQIIKEELENSMNELERPSRSEKPSLRFYEDAIGFRFSDAGAFGDKPVDIEEIVAKLREGGLKAGGEDITKKPDTGIVIDMDVVRGGGPEDYENLMGKIAERFKDSYSLRFSYSRGGKVVFKDFE